MSVKLFTAAVYEWISDSFSVEATLIRLTLLIKSQPNSNIETNKRECMTNFITAFI